MGPLEGLPTGWGIRTLPCTKTSVLDCFKEGGYDYPTDLKVMEKVIPKLNVIMQADTPKFRSCMTQLYSLAESIAPGRGKQLTEATGDAITALSLWVRRFFFSFSLSLFLLSSECFTKRCFPFLSSRDIGGDRLTRQ